MSTEGPRPKFCTECGSALAAGAKFCGECGTRIAPPAGDSPPGTTAPTGPQIPPELKAKFEAAQKELRGDRREVVVLFADLKGFTAMSEKLDPEEVSLIMQRLLGELSEAVHKYEGYVDKYIGDSIMALFGAPLAHENDPERAVLTALEMLQVVARRNEGTEHPLSLRVGLNLGDVVAADMGSEGRVQYTVMGDTVNVASRLEGAAQPDSILISHSVYERIAHRFDTEEVPPVTVKGKSEPLRVRRVHGVRSAVETRAANRTSFVGREKELAALAVFLDRVAEGQGQLVLIEAEAGAGKSRLISEAIDRSVAEELVVEVAFNQIQLPGQPPPAADLFTRLLGWSAAESPDSLFERASAALGSQANEHKRGIHGLVRQALPAFVGRPADTEVPDARAARQSRWVALAALVTAVARTKPTVIIVEDVHWADEEGQEFLAFLVPALARKPVGFILTARLDGRPAWLSPTTDTLRLEALDEEAASSILGGILESMSPSVRREIIRRSQGNPLYLEELARSLSQTAEEAALSVPGSVQGLLQSRIDRLDPPVRLLIQMAAVLGPRFSVGLLNRMYALDPQTMLFDAALTKLEEQGFVEGAVGEDARRFRHALMQEVAYGGILVRLRKILHESAAHLGEEHYADTLESEAPFFAHHYWEADLRERAAPHLYRAAINAASRYDLPAAERWFGQLAQVEAEHPDVLSEAADRATMRIHYGAVLLDRGRYDAADDQFVRLEKFGSEMRRDDWVGEALRYRGQIATLRGRLADARVLFESGLERVPATEKQISAGIRTGLGLALYYGSDANGALGQFETALQLYQEIGDRLGQAKCHINIGNVLDDLKNDSRAAEPTYEKALALIEEVDDRRLKTGVLLNLGTLATGRGDWNDALARFRHVETLAEEIGWSFMRFLSLQNQASCNLSLGRLANAILLLDTCMREGEMTMRGDDRIRVRVLLSEAYLSALDPTRPLEMLNAARSVAAELEMHELEDTIRLAEGRLLAAAEDWQGAVEAFSESVEAAVRLGHPTVEPLARAHLYRARCRNGEQPDPPATDEEWLKPTRAIVSYLTADGAADLGPSETAARELEEAGELAAEIGFVALERAAFERAASVREFIRDPAGAESALRRAALAMAGIEANLPEDLREAFSAHPRNEALRALIPA